MIVLTALVDHGTGGEARRGASAMSAACQGEPARTALLAALAAASPRGLHVEDLSLALVARNKPKAAAAAPASADEEEDDIAERHAAAVRGVHPSARAAQALRAMGAGSFREEALMDGNVHAGFARGDSFARAGRACAATAEA